MKYFVGWMLLGSLWLLVTIVNPLVAQPVDIDLTLLRQIKLGAEPLDVTVSGDGKLFFVLTPGEVAVYSGLTDQPFKRIPVDKNVDRLSYANTLNALILTNTKASTVTALEIDPIQEISIEGSPFKGPENAPVTLAVFDDYQ